MNNAMLLGEWLKIRVVTMNDEASRVKNKFFSVVSGKGEFGEVVLTRAQGIVDGEKETMVMVKALQSRDENVHFEFKREMDMFHKLNHDNVVRLLGICRDAEPALVILEFTDVVSSLLILRLLKGHR